MGASRGSTGAPGMWRLFCRGLPDAIFLRFAEAEVRRLDAPDFHGLQRGGGADGEGFEVEFVFVFGVSPDERLAVVDEDFDEVFVDEDAQIEVSAGGQAGEGEWGLGGADAQ